MNERSSKKKTKRDHDFAVNAGGPRMLMQNRNQSDLSCEAVTGACLNSCGGMHPVPAVLGRFLQRRQVPNCSVSISQ